MTPGAVIYACRTVSESNAREHWAPRAKRAADHRRNATLVTRSTLLCPLPIVVTLTRVAPRALDDDNLRGALKATRDGVADAFGVSDRDPRVEWRYGQRRGGVRVFQVEIAVRVATPAIERPEPSSWHWDP